MDIFTYIGVGVVAGSIVGAVLAATVDFPPVAVGAIIGVTANVSSWYVTRRRR